MSHAPFDGVLLDDARPPVSGAVALLLHLRVTRRQWGTPSLDFVRARAQACRELLAQGLLPGTLRSLRAHGLELGDPRASHSLASLAAHLEAYLVEVERAGCLEPDEALWRAVDRELSGGRGLWIERGPEDGPVRAGLRDLQGARLRALACLPALGGATFALATRKGSGLFGSSLPLVAWLLDGLEQHGQDLAGELQLEEPEGWGAAPWTGALDRLFEGPLELGEHQERVQRRLVEGPADLLRHAVEVVCGWLEEGIAPREITVIHPEPHRAAAFLGPLLAAEGVALHVRGGLPTLLEGRVWSPLWSLLQGLQRLDPCTFAAGLKASGRRDLRLWADILATADQDGETPFEEALPHLETRSREGAEATWRDLSAWRTARLPAREWAGRLESLAGVLRLAADSESFFAPLGLLKEAWGLEPWTLPEMLTALEAFLEAARSPEVPREAEGLRLVSPGTLLDDWEGARATLVLDLSEGAWPAAPGSQPDLDWNRKAAINRALLEASRAGETTFPPALQRFWLPRSEHGDQVPRMFQQEAYGFNKLLAMTRERFVALSPAQDGEGRTRAQGPFWTALEGAGEWAPDPARAMSRLRWEWEGRDRNPQARARAEAARARAEEEALGAEAPDFDRVAGAREAWLRGRPAAPTALETLAGCPFRSMAERLWGLSSFDARGRFHMAVGILTHHLLEHALRPYLGLKGWTEAFLAAHEASLGQDLQRLWEEHRATWLAELKDIPQEQWPQAELEVEGLLPNLAAALLADAKAKGPAKWENALLFPEADAPSADGWTRTLVALEAELGPVELGGLAVAGKVDRLERWEHLEGPAFWRILDYKTSRASRLRSYGDDGGAFADHLQTPLYMRLVEALHGGAATAALIPLRDEEPEAVTEPLRALVEEGDWRGRLDRGLAAFAARLERGDFPPVPGERCTYCRLGALCGRPVDVEGEEEE